MWKANHLKISRTCTWASDQIGPKNTTIQRLVSSAVGSPVCATLLPESTCCGENMEGPQRLGESINR